MQNRPSFPPQPTVCWGCGLPGHIKRNCPSNRPGVLGPSPSYLANRGSKNGQDDSNVYIMMKVLGKEVFCIVDSGCDVTIVPKELTDRCNSLRVRASTRQIWAANNTPIHIFGETDLPLELDGRCLWTPVLISEDVDEVMLGFDWLVNHNCLWDFNTGRLTVDGRETVALGYRGYPGMCRLICRFMGSTGSRPMVAHVGRLGPWNTDNPPRSWLTDDLPGGGNGDRGWNADDGVVVSSTVDRRDAGAQADDVGVEVLHTGNSRHSGGAVDFADPGPVEVDVNKGSGEVACVLGPGGQSTLVTMSVLRVPACSTVVTVEVWRPRFRVPVDRSTMELRGWAVDNVDPVTVTTFWWALVRPPGKAAYRGWARARSMSVLEIRMKSFLRAPAPVFGLARVGRTPSPPVV